MSSVSELPAFDALGVPVQVRCEDPLAAERLAVCYAAFPAATRGAAPVLGASLEGGGESWTVRVDGREQQSATDLVSAVRSFNHELMHGVMLRARQLFYVHAGVVELGGRGIVLPGLSRAGKSTLTLALVREGARLLSDELLAFDPDAGLCRAFPRSVKVRDVCVPYFGDVEEHFVGSGEGRFLPFPALPADSVAAEAPVSAVVIPVWNGTRSSTIEEVGRGTALLELTASALNFGTHRAASIDVLTAMVKESVAHRLTWREPREGAKLVIEALECSRR